jgi:hypothetical protein
LAPQGNIGMTLLRFGIAAGLIWTVAASAASTDPSPGAPLTLVIQPAQDDVPTPNGYPALAAYLAETSGSRVSIVVPPNFLAHWETIRRNRGVDLVLDDAHFTDYRVQRLGFQVLVKLPGVAGYSLVGAPGLRVRDPLSLTGKKVACFGPPSLGATRLNAMFPNPARRPSIVDITTVQQGLDLLAQNKVVAAMLPTAVISAHIGQGRLVVLTTMEPTPGLALSASSHIDAARRQKIRAALLRAPESEEGRHMLQALGISRFEFADESTYANQGRLLRDVWGY